MHAQRSSVAYACWPNWSTLRADMHALSILHASHSFVSEDYDLQTDETDIKCPADMYASLADIDACCELSRFG